MMYPDSTQRQPDAYTQHAFAGGISFSSYTPNDEERSARAAKDRAEATKTQAEADQITDGLRTFKWKLRAKYACLTLGIFGFGMLCGAIIF